VDLGHRVEHRDPGAEPRRHQHLPDRAVGVVEAERERLVLLDLHVVPDLVDVGVEVGPRQRPDVRLGQGLLPPHQGQAGEEATQVPLEVTEVGLVEVVDVEDEDTLGVHVGAEVLRMQVAVDPHPAGPVVCLTASESRHVGIEEARAAAVEGEGVGGHLAELGAETVGVGLHQWLERLDQRRDDQLLPLRVARCHASDPRRPPGGILRDETVAWKRFPTTVSSRTIQTTCGQGRG
jgi:hypothetical protein